MMVSLFYNFYSSIDSNIPEILLYTAEKCKTRRSQKKKKKKKKEKKKNGKASGNIANIDFA